MEAPENGGGPLTLEQAASALGVHYMTAYRYIRIGRLPAEYRSGRWYVHPCDLAKAARTKRSRPVDGASEGAAAPVPGPDASTPTVDLMQDRLLAGDAAGAWLIVENALLAGSPSDVHLEVLAPCLRRIGDSWARGEISIADEHRATALALGLIGRLGPLFARRGRHRAGTVLLAGAEGDTHAIPLMMVGDQLRGAGFSVNQLGADVPLDALVATAAGIDGLLAVGLSASTAQAAANAARAVTALHRRLPGVPVFLGGPAVRSEEAARELGADGWARDAATAVSLLTSLESP